MVIILILVYGIINQRKLNNNTNEQINNVSGPVPIEYGITSILMPLVFINIKNVHVYRR